jgi:hypothetical protein
MDKTTIYFKISSFLMWQTSHPKSILKRQLSHIGPNKETLTWDEYLIHVVIEYPVETCTYCSNIKCMFSLLFMYDNSNVSWHDMWQNVHFMSSYFMSFIEHRTTFGRNTLTISGSMMYFCKLTWSVAFQVINSKLAGSCMGGISCDADEYAARFGNLLPQVLHWWLI